jgi:hypothetical protein
LHDLLRLLFVFVLLNLDGVLDGPLEFFLLVLLEVLEEVHPVLLGVLLLHRLEDLAAEENRVEGVQIRVKPSEIKFTFAGDAAAPVLVVSIAPDPS